MQFRNVSHKKKYFPARSYRKFPAGKFFLHMQPYAAYELAMKAYLAKSLTDDIILSYCLDSGEKYG